MRLTCTWLPAFSQGRGEHQEVNTENTTLLLLGRTMPG